MIDSHALLRAGLLWVYSDHPQQKGALISHHGIYAKYSDAVNVQIAPIGAHDLPAVVFKRSNITKGMKHIGRKLQQQLTDALPTGVRIADRWNGGDCYTISFGLSRRATSSVVSLIQTYSMGCTEHRNSVLCDCLWFQRGYDLARLPDGWH